MADVVVPIRVCSTCGESKPTTDYYPKHDRPGKLMARCKLCQNKACADAYQNNIAHHRARCRAYNLSQTGRDTRARYFASGKGDDLALRGRRKRAASGKYAANRAVNIAVKEGRLPHVTTRQCEHCGHKAAEYHHPSYEPSKHLDVIPLCMPCHKFLHRKPLP